MSSSARAADPSAATCIDTQKEDLLVVDTTTAVGGPSVSSSVPQ